MKEQVTGEMLLQRRSELRLSRIDVSKMFGVTERTIINWENGRKITSSKFDMVADFVSGKGAAGVPLEVLEYCIGQSVKRNRPIFNYVKVMRRHADEAIRKILDNVKREGS